MIARFDASLSEEGRYRLLVESITDYAIYMLDIEGRVTSWNAGAQRFKGYTAQEIDGQHFSRFYTDADREAGLPAQALATAAADGRFEGEGWRVRKDSSRFWAHVVIHPVRDSNGRLVGYAKVTRDLTERRATERALQQSQEQFRLLVQGVTDYAIYMLDPLGHVASWNAGAERIKGYSTEEIVGKHFSQFYQVDDRRRGEPALALETAAREGRYESEGWRVRKSGDRFWASVVIDPIRGGDGTIIGYAKITRDVTEKREAQQALERTREKLFQARKLDAVGQLTGGVAHDFNNLLMVIMTSLEMLRRRLGGDDSKRDALLQSAELAARRGASLTQRMLAFARQQDLKPADVDLLQLLGGIADLLRQSVGPSVRIRYLVPPGLTPVRVDANQLELVLLNLAVNARDAMPDGGSVTIHASEETSEAADLDLVPGAYVRLSVGDEGCGMDAVTLARATEPFFTTKGVGKGTGLGLSMVQGLATQSGGQFRLVSQLGRGTTAELWLPVATSNVARPAPVETVRSEKARGPSLVALVVDDDPLVLQSTLAMLEALGHTARGTTSPDEALALLRTDLRYRLLLTDQLMPDMKGDELIRSARDVRPDLRTILASGFMQATSEPSVVVVKLTKPYGQAELALAIEASSML
ncbi:MAG: sensor hybrid histidine kinase [Rhizobacter sp.]|nr:sensor hybrid histidine kinase [Rhizobacter sp.]